MTVSIEKWFDGHKCWETTAVSSVVAARQQLQSIKSEIMQSKIYCVFKDTPNEFSIVMKMPATLNIGLSNTLLNNRYETANKSRMVGFLHELLS